MLININEFFKPNFDKVSYYWNIYYAPDNVSRIH